MASPLVRDEELTVTVFNSCESPSVDQTRPAKPKPTGQPVDDRPRLSSFSVQRKEKSQGPGHRGGMVGDTRGHRFLIFALLLATSIFVYTSLSTHAPAWTN